jgi:two-component system, cell cycle sensor histidine kinase and response regulator CckA
MVSAVQPLAERWDDLAADRLAPVLDRSPEGVALLEHGSVIYANPAFAALAGTPGPGALLGKPLASFRPEFDFGCFPGDNQPAQTCSRHPVCEFDRLGLDGTPVRVEASCTPFPWEGRELLIVNLRDVSERERRRALYESACRIRSIFHSMAIGIAQCSRDGRIVESNPAIERLLGYSHEGLHGRFLQDLFPEDITDRYLRLFDQSGNQLPQTYQADHRFVGNENGERWVRFTASLVQGVDQDEPTLLVIVDEITEYKLSERRLRDAQKMEVIGRLVGGVAHDFNNLLTGIMLYCDLLSAGLRKNVRMRHHAEEIRMAGEQGAALVQQLLAIARQQVVEPRVFCVNAKIVEMREMLSRLIGENIDLQTELEPALGNVRLDPGQFQQILLNLVLNARDAMPGGGRILVRTENCEYQLAGTAPVGPLPAVRLTLTDQGCGMSAETRSHLFEPFFTTKSAGRGNGLGLATLHEIVQSAGGAIQVESEVDRGTTFRITLPRVPQAPQSAIPEFHYSPHATNETILVLEDNVTVRQAACRVLRDCGYAVLEAGTGPEVLAQADAHDGAIDLLLADLALPGMSGRFVARRLRATRPELVCLYMSGYDPQARLHPDEFESVVHFQKPFTGAVLLQKVREILEARTSAPLRNESEQNHDDC